MRTAADDGIDLSEAEALFGLPFNIPIRPAASIRVDELSTLDKPMASLTRFVGPPLGQFGIEYDLVGLMMSELDGDPGVNEMLLHEVVHAWQWFSDPAGFEARHASELAEYGYWDAPHEVQARQLAHLLNEAGVRVYFPERARPRAPGQDARLERHGARGCARHTTSSV